MTDSSDSLDRRQFLKAVGAAGLCPILASSALGAAADGPAGKPATAPADPKTAGQVPKRKLGKTGVEITVVGLGSGTVDLASNQDVLTRALKCGITYWDTSISYGGSELGIGRFFARDPALRPRIFLVTKTADITTPMPVIADVERQFRESLKQLGTDYIDLYLGVHAMPDARQLTDEVRQWADEKKKKGLIKFFGFSTHSNMDRNLMAASKLDWIDACLVRCDFRVMREPRMQEAIEACSKAGIGLIAIKAMGAGLNTNSAEDRKLSNYFTDKGYDQHQAKIKALLEDKRFTAAAVGMRNPDIVESCAKAVVDKATLSQADHAALRQYAQATCDSYCAGCDNICAAALPDVGTVSDVMRYLMYHNTYGDRERARGLFARIPPATRLRLLAADYRPAEARCPQHIPIGKMVAEAFRRLA